MSGSWQEATVELEARLDYVIGAVQGGMPESWDGDAAAESLIVDYVRELERRVLALGGSLERVPEDADGAPLPDTGTSPQAYTAAVRGGPVLADRRQRAREAFHDARAAAAVEFAEHGLDEAIETATRVRVTPEIVEASMAEPFITTAEALARAFRAAGFEVEQ